MSWMVLFYRKSQSSCFHLWVAAAELSFFAFVFCLFLEETTVCSTSLVGYTQHKWGGLFSFYSSPNTRRMIPLASLSNQGICAKMESVKEKLLCKWSDQRGYHALLFHVWGTLKCCIAEARCGQWGIQTAGPRSVGLTASQQASQ